ncbi:Por secretion system C-terminal sorting domain-containing protein [Marivirga sericea]|uniref:Por secretion system C-terminal sorting domain-containing protein n=1 Tax=Marivirga sericea TaxID=1028 RepID=A0A1X7JZG6_9BACT|nr:T9SS type A sorting domain-containing protein [Marivirga sericea]SMG33984.1 Por secretion system C-terminal sorting domain-containing protein [Marivirga sericea]
MKKILFLLLISFPAFSQSSFDEQSGAWTANSTWNGSNAPGTSGLKNINLTINGTVTRTGNLDFDQNVNITLNNSTDDTDTLIVTGDLIFKNNTVLTIRGSSILIVLGDLESNNNINVSSSGKLVVVGSASTGNNTNISNSGDFYILGTNNLGTGGGSNYAGTTPGNAQDMVDNDQALADYLVNELGVTNATLPIELKSFNASKSKQNIDLNWVTAKEENFSHFEVERSLDQNKWKQIGLVQGIGESNSDVHYDFTDRNTAFGIIYYRLKAVDIDASFEYSPVVKIEVGFEGKLAVSPNPIKNVSNLKIQVPTEFREDLAYIGLFDLNGIKVQEFRNFDTNGTLQVNQKLKSGMYILRVNHNGLQENIRVIVQ